MSEIIEGDVLDREEMRELVSDGAIIGGLTRAEIDVQIATAHRWPRSPTKVQRQIETYATLDVETAMSCFYRLPQRVKDQATGKWVDTFLEGPSARFAEIALSAWGNARAASRRTDLTKEDVEATGIFHDLETNVAVARSVRRPILNARGERFPQHLIGVTSNAAASIALRNAILTGIPKAAWGRGYAKALEAAKGTAETLVERRKLMLGAFEEMNVPAAQVYDLLGVTGQMDITIDLLFTASGLLSAIRDGDTTIDALLQQRRGGEPEAPARALDAAAFGEGKAIKAPVEPDPSLVVDGIAYPNKARANAALKKKALDEETRKAAELKEAEAAKEVEEEPPAAIVEAATATAAADVFSDPEAAEGEEGESRSPPSSEDSPPPDEEAPASSADPTRAEPEQALHDSFVAFCAKADSWLSIKPNVARLRADERFQSAHPALQRETLLCALGRTSEIGDSVRPDEDPAFFRLWLLEAEQADVPGVYRKLLRTAAYQKLPEDERDQISDEMERAG